MLGAGVQFNRSRNGDDRFYNAAKARRSHTQSFQSHDQLRRAQSDIVGVKPDGHAATDEPPRKNKHVTVAGAATKPTPSCNLDRFLESVTPAVTAQHLSKTTMRGWRTCDVEFQHYFVLGDLWESFKEWSAYGAGVPLILNDRDSVIQYYVPYLSGIQLYGDSLKTSAKSRRLGEDTDGDSFRDSSSEGSSDSEQERGCSNTLIEPHYRQTCDVSHRLEQLSVRDQHAILQDGFSSDESESGSSQGSLLFEYLERVQPYSREPLYDKISDLARRFPKLKTLRSCDLLPSSWISVAWYPIYRIPMGPTLKDLDACFLSFHSLHTPTTGPRNVHAPVLIHPSEVDGIAKLLLPVFGLASYKFRGSLWTPNGGYERQLVNSLVQSAENWLASVQVNHPDFLFFRHR